MTLPEQSPVLAGNSCAGVHLEPLPVGVEKDRHSDPPSRDSMMPEAWYAALDPGIRFAVRVLHAAGGVETCQSCQGGAGHAYSQATVDLVAGSDDAAGFRALAALQEYGLPVDSVALVWNVRHGLPYERLWRVTFSRPAPERAGDRPMFIHSYVASGLPREYLCRWCGRVAEPGPDDRCAECKKPAVQP